jgi:hypothetical protein
MITGKVQEQKNITSLNFKLFNQITLNMNFSWKYQTPNKGWWADYRWHTTETSEKSGLKSNGWKKTFFRQGWQGKLLEVENIEGAKKCLQSLQNGVITAFGGRFRGASYDKNAKRIIKQAKRSLKEAIERHEKGEDINVKEIAVAPPSYYNWEVIISISGILIFIVVVILYLCFKKKKEKIKPWVRKKSAK